MPPRETLLKRKLSRKGLLLIKSLEGFRPRTITRRDGTPTIGYGHTQSARDGVEITEPEAELLLLHDLIPIVDYLNRELRGPVNQNQFDALTSFIFNIGLDRFKQSDVLRLVRKRKMVDAATALAQIPDRKPPANDLPYRRRCSERALFETPPDQKVELHHLLTAPVTRPNAFLPPLPEVPLGQTGVVRHEDAPLIDTIAPITKIRPRKDASSFATTLLIILVGLIVGAAIYLALKQGLIPQLAERYHRVIGLTLSASGLCLLGASLWAYFGPRKTARMN